MKTFIQSFFIVGLLLLSATSFAQYNVKKLDQFFDKTREEWGIPGMSIAIVYNSEVIFKKGYGVLEEGKKEKTNEHTLYAIASNTKGFTTTALAILVQEGKLSWDDKVKDHLPYFALYDEYASAETTVEDLLCHRVGLATFGGDVIWYKSELLPEDIIKRIRYLPGVYSFRNGYGYSNLMFITAGELIHKITGMSVGEYFEEQFFQRLNMDRTATSILNLAASGNVATPHMPKGDKNIPLEWADWKNVTATGGIISSVSEMASWMIFNLNNGILKGDTILTSTSRNKLWSIHNPHIINQSDKDFATNFAGYGLGWGLADYHGNMVVYHGGGYDGMYSRVAMIPDKNWGIVVLTNSMKPVMNVITGEAMDVLLGITSDKDRSAKALEGWKEKIEGDKRIEDIKAARVDNTKPTLPMEKYTGSYYADMYGEITIEKSGDRLILDFSHAPKLRATLKHWHYDTWEIDWDEDHAWFDFGTVQFKLNDKLEITGMDINVPNDDIFFHELDIRKL